VVLPVRYLMRDRHLRSVYLSTQCVPISQGEARRTALPVGGEHSAHLRVEVIETYLERLNERQVADTYIICMQYIILCTRRAFPVRGVIGMCSVCISQGGGARVLAS
jgi:hypothetical protein